MERLPNHPGFIRPDNPDAHLWRYMDLAKFVALLQTAELYFHRADAFEDALEGSLTFGMQERLRMHGGTESRRKRREHVYINCWHLSERESVAMWSLYGRAGGSVAIRTTYSRLIKILPDEFDVGLVRYVDFSKSDDSFDIRNVFTHFFLKRESFAHEQELRVIGIDEPGRIKPSASSIVGKGLKLSISLGDLVENVFVSPKADPWFGDVVRKLASTYDLAAPVIQSELDATPMF